MRMLTFQDGGSARVGRVSRELAGHPNSMNKSANHRYHHFVNVLVVTDTKMKRADAVRCAQAEWKERVVTNEEQYTTALQEAAEYLKRNRTRQIDSFFKVRIHNMYRLL